MPITPYQRLLDKIVKYARKVKCRRVKSAFNIPKDKLNAGWDLEAVYHGVNTARHLGYETIIEATDKGLEIKYREEVQIPIEWQ